VFTYVRKVDIFNVIPAIKLFRLEILFHQILYLDHVMLSSLVNKRNKESVHAVLVYACLQDGVRVRHACSNLEFCVLQLI